MASDIVIEHKFAKLYTSEFSGLSSVDPKAEDATEVAKIVAMAVNHGKDVLRKATIPVLDVYCPICDKKCERVGIANADLIMDLSHLVRTSQWFARRAR